MLVLKVVGKTAQGRVYEKSRRVNTRTLGYSN